MALSPQALAALRQDYSQRGLELSQVHSDPVLQFQHWLKEAHDAELLEPNAMTLATVDAEGQPWTRTVLLKRCDHAGFAFFTNYNGAKAAQMEANPRAALTFWWGALERQVNVTGRISRTTAEESDAYFASRPLASQLGAWASPQSAVLERREELEERFEHYRNLFATGPVPRPEHWGGFVLHPSTIEFWQGRRSRLHDRLRFKRAEAETWQIERLAP